MAQSEDESKDVDALEAISKRGGDSSDDLMVFKRRRTMGSPLLPEEAADSNLLEGGGSQPLQEEEAEGDAAAFNFTETRQTGGDPSSLDDSLMALLLPDGLAAAEATDAPSEQRAAADRSSSPSGSGEGAVSTVLPVELNSSKNMSLSLEAGHPTAESHPVQVQNVIASGRIEVAGRHSAALDLRRIAVSCRFAEYNPRKVNACIVRLRKPKCTGMIFRSGRVMVTGAQSEDAALRAARLLVKMLQAIFCPSSTSSRGVSPRLPASSPQGSEGTGNEREGPLALTASEGVEEGSNDKAPKKTTQEIEGSIQKDKLTENESSAASEGAEKGRAEKGRDELAVVPANDASRSTPPPPLSALSKRSFTDIRLTEFAVENIVATADCGLPVRLEGLAFDHKEFCSYEPELFAGRLGR
ncbi:TATA-box binding protein, putative [Eimeria praecox]|uniref:TATA-box binding protein, putative n=1 Tax=Eimeria praecox TaxID=51316 RepID=U6G5V5_9EIME|nr:TATA-box binding protein, putative [Eimeria praecox]